MNEGDVPPFRFRSYQIRLETVIVKGHQLGVMLLPRDLLELIVTGKGTWN